MIAIASGSSPHAATPRRVVGDSLPWIGRRPPGARPAHRAAGRILAPGAPSAASLALLTSRGFGPTVFRATSSPRRDIDMEIKPLRGYRYAGDMTRDLSTVVAPPYDQISAETQDRLYALSPDNIVRVTYPKDAADKYRRARDVLDGWLGEGVWRRDERPAIYPYDQTFSVAGQSVTRTGFVALGQVTDYARGVVLPHERTHAGPKRDRMELLEATGADTGLLFMLASDPDGELRRATAPVGQPIAEARDLKGERHRLWRTTDDAAIA